MRITQRFGKENTAPSLFEKYAEYGLIGHNGVDIVFPKVKIYCPVDGKVVYLADNYDDGYGAYVKILANGYYHYFCHLLSWSDDLKTMTVEKGQYIGDMGGSSLGERDHYPAHLHYGIKPVNANKKNGYRGYVDPETIVNIRELEGVTE